MFFTHTVQTHTHTHAHTHIHAHIQVYIHTTQHTIYNTHTLHAYTACIHTNAQKY